MSYEWKLQETLDNAAEDFGYETPPYETDYEVTHDSLSAVGGRWGGFAEFTANVNGTCHLFTTFTR